ncbi:MAG: epimerase [Candidatus Eisenbacteria bacterium]|nr:epimerase [Candidatus Eisenbacteria bacterium]
MEILILGGTVFLGRALVDAALARGHRVTTFTRGKHNPELYAGRTGVMMLHGDRDGGLSALGDGRWDAVIDTCGYFPRVVRASAEHLRDRAGLYTFISSISVYPDLSIVGIDETAAVGTVPDPTVEEITGETYGPLKALCEEEVEKVFPGRTLRIRPGLIVGPHDPSDRFTYWPERVAAGGEVLAPDRPDVVVQVIDVRDLADWTIRMVERGETGIYNATGPDEAHPLTIGRILDASKRESGSDATFVWVPQAFLVSHGIEGWMDLPVWVPEGGDSAGLHTADVSKAVTAGLAFRPIEETVRDTLAWVVTLPPDRPRRAGLTREREQEILRAWWESGESTSPSAGPG